MKKGHKTMINYIEIKALQELLKSRNENNIVLIINKNKLEIGNRQGLVKPVFIKLYNITSPQSDKGIGGSASEIRKILNELKLKNHYVAFSTLAEMLGYASS